MTTIIRGHGELASDRPMTFVPDGVEIKFFSDLDDPLWTSNALAVLNSGDFGSPNESYGPGSVDNPVEIPNYEMSARSSGEVQRDLSADLGKAPILFIGDQITGDPVHLCEGTEETCKDGVHGCDGVFGQVHDKDLVYLACRGVEGEDRPGTDAIGPDGDTSFANNYDAWTAKFKNLIKSDPDQAIADFEQLSQADQAMALTDGTIKNWSFVREARAFALQDPQGFARQAAGMERDGSDDEALAAYRKDPELSKLFPEIDQDAVTSANDTNLKGARNKGDELPFWQYGDTVLIGPGGHDQTYVDFLAAVGKSGTITVISRGSLTSPGEIEVSGAENQDAFKQAIRDFSKKKITFS